MNKLKNWSLQLKRPILILGDSNMARLPRAGDQRIQVVCYLGASWFHTHEIIRNKTPTSNWVTMVILSFGINDRAYGSTGLVEKWIKKTLGAAEYNFLNAQILIPVISFHRYQHWKNNRHPPQPVFSNRVGPDLLDSKYGLAMWKHWLARLN